MTILRYQDHPSGRRCYVMGRRLHHGLAGIFGIAGLALAGASEHKLPLALAVAAVVHDARDFPFRDRDNH